MHSLFPTARQALFGALILASTIIAPHSLFAQTANTAYGVNALTPNTGSYNSAFGFYSLFYNTSGFSNTAIGAQSLFSNGSGFNNVAVGVNALYANTWGSYNTANGASALYTNSSGTFNTAIGNSALYFNTTGNDNTASGTSALLHNTTGNSNTASGVTALYNNTAGNSNTAYGLSALVNNTTGNSNTASGMYSLLLNTTGSNNVAMGYASGSNVTTGSNNIEIGNQGIPGDDATVRIGSSGIQSKTFIAGISGVVASGGVQVYINSAGQLGTLTSSQRFKKDIKSIDNISDKLMQLRPVSFVYKEDDKSQLQYGLIAEEVAKVYPELVQFDKDGKPFTVYYHLLAPLLLNELQKEHQKVAEQQEQLVSLNQQMTAQRNEMLAMIQQQKQEMVLLQQKLNQLGAVSQANNTQPRRSNKVAFVSGY